MMNKLTNKDIQLLAQSSRLSVSIDNQLDAILGYSESIMNNVSLVNIDKSPQVLIMRSDECVPTDSQSIMSQSISENNYFVVPVVISSR